tara:strand:+ start:1272 stop:2861 length:1590 start_codon:yes stop_codon:yes gene_type:complete
MAQNLKINITAQDKTKQALSGVRGRLAGLKKAIFSVQGALVAIGGGLAIKSIIGTGRSIEDLQVRLKQLFGSTQEGAKAFDVMAKFAGRVPFSLEQIQSASGNLAVVAGDADRLSKILEITGNVASVTGLDFTTTAEQIQRSFAGGIASADIFRERGVRDLLGFSAGATVSAEETVVAFEKVFGKGGRFGTATEELATTFTGTLSMLGDKLFNFKRTVAGEGFFDELKKEFKSLNQFIEDNAKEFEAIGKAISFVLTVAVKGFALAIRGVAKAVGALRTGYDALLRTLNKIPFVNIEISDTQKAINKDMLDYEFQAYKNNKANESNLKSLAKQKVLTEEIIKILDKKLKGLTNTASQVARVLQMGIDGFSKGLAESIVMGKELNITMKELGRTLLTEVLATLIKIVAQRAVMYSISKAEAQMKSMSGGNGIGSVISGVFGSILGKANGGSVSKGQPYMVGEQGAELFVPNQSGQIQQSARGNEKSPVNVNFNINTLDASGFDELLVRNRGTITQLINNAVNERGSRNLI